MAPWISIAIEADPSADPVGQPARQPQAEEADDAPTHIKNAIFLRRLVLFGRQVVRHPTAHGAKDAAAGTGDKQRDQGRGQYIRHEHLPDTGLVAEMFGTRYMATLLGISFVMH
jgi:hypothetical protein